MEKEKKSHKERVLDYLMSRWCMKHGATICEINERLRIGDARERIRDLRHEGHNIETRHRDSNDEYHAYGRYYYHYPVLTSGQALDRLNEVRDCMNEQQYQTLRGQILAGQIDAALAGLRVILHRAGAI